MHHLTQALLPRLNSRDTMTEADYIFGAPIFDIRVLESNIIHYALTFSVAALTRGVISHC